MMITEDIMIRQQIDFDYGVFSGVHFLCSFSLPVHLPAADHVMHPRPIQDARAWSDREEQFFHLRFSGMPS